MKELLSRVGIGAATVDTVLPTDTLTAGEPVDVRVDVEGGDVAQDVDAIYFALCTRYRSDDATHRGVVQKSQLSESFTVDAGESRSFDVTVPVPVETPVTMGRTDVWVETGLDVDWAVDPDDTDYVDVDPGPRVSALLDAIDDLGFRVRTAEPVKSERGLFASAPRFVQEFEFVPRSGDFRGRVDELEVVVVPGEDELDVYLEVDKRGGLFSEAMDVDERFDRFTVTATDVGEVRDEVRARVERHA